LLQGNRVGVAKRYTEITEEWMPSAAASRTNVVTFRKSVLAFDQTDLGVERSGEIEKPAEGIGDAPTSHIGAGLLLSYGGGVVDPALHIRKVDALHCKVLHTVPGEALMDLRNARCIRRALECLVDKVLCISFVENVFFVELNDVVVKDQDTGRLAVLLGELDGISAVPDYLGLLEAK
jgi:hypothetical protein